MSSTYNEEKKLSIKRKAKKRKQIRATIIIAVIILLAAIIIVGGFFLIRYRSYKSFTVTATTDLAGASDNLAYYSFADGYIQCSNTGIVYFDTDSIIWEDAFQMDHPILDICDDYIAVADLKQNDVYLYDESGIVNHISTSHEIIDIEVSSKGMVALSTNDGDSNYIELKSSDGSEIINVKSVFSSSGYLDDITLSDDGTKLAAAFIYVSQGSLVSKVLFYDFSNTNTDEMLVGGFSQYEDTVITDVEFMNDNVVCAVGDNALTFYRFNSTPEIISEQLNLEWEIQSIDINKKHVLLVTKDSTGENNYRAYVYNNSGKQSADIGFDFAYSKARLDGSNILLYSSTDFQIISFNGIQRFSGSAGSKILYMLPLSRYNKFILASSESVRFIKLK